MGGVRFKGMDAVDALSCHDLVQTVGRGCLLWRTNIPTALRCIAYDLCQVECTITA